MKKKFYVTTAIDYIDDVMHIGHAYQKIVADVLARYHRLRGESVFFLTGVDEHGGKAEEAAKKAKIGFKEWADKISKADKEQFKSLNISYDRFIRTTDQDHQKTVVEFWQKVKKKGDIYLGEYKGIYCQGCEGFITQKDLIDGKCPYHPNEIPKKLTEKNYFFRWSKYEGFLKNQIRDNPKFVQPESKRNEMLAFLNQGLEDIPISRPSVEWGIPVPSDPKHTIYVWFDALINYLSGAPKGFWPADLHLLGKDNLRWHALLWPAMLKSAGYELPKTVYAHDFFTFNGQKISKSLGNVIRPTELVKEFGTDGVRYYFIKYGPISRDVDLTIEKLKEVYNADLANGLGNLVSRVFGMVDRYCDNKLPKISVDPDSLPLRVSPKLYTWKKVYRDLDKYLPDYQFDKALRAIWKFISVADKYIDDNKPWQLAKEGKIEELNQVLYCLCDSIHQISWQIYPFLPETSVKIAKALDLKALLKEVPLGKNSWANVKPGTKIKLEEPLFPRLE